MALAFGRHASRWKRRRRRLISCMRAGRSWNARKVESPESNSACYINDLRLPTEILGRPTHPTFLFVLQIKDLRRSAAYGLQIKELRDSRGSIFLQRANTFSIANRS